MEGALSLISFLNDNTELDVGPKKCIPMNSRNLLDGKVGEVDFFDLALFQKFIERCPDVFF